MSSDSPEDSIHYIDYKEEIARRMEMYHDQPDLITLLLNAYKLYEESFSGAAKALGLDIVDDKGNFRNPQSITLAQIEDIAREMSSCGYEFLESGYKEDQKFYRYIPIRYQPYLDELFEFAFHRELGTMQYCIDEFVKEAHVDLEELSAIDLGEEEITLITTEKIAQALCIPAFELIKHEYIMYVATKIREYNPHRAFHRLSSLTLEDKHKIMLYFRYIVQGDKVVSSGELRFIDQVISKLDLQDFDIESYKKDLYREIPFSELETLSPAMLEPLRRQVLGLVIDSAYADRMLNLEEGPRILKISQLIMEASA